MARNITASKTLKIFGAVLPILLILIFLLFPVVSVLVTSFYDGTKFSFEYIGEILSSKLYYGFFGFTLSQALLSTLITLLIGIPIGYIFGRYDFPGRRITKAIFTVPFVLPTVLVGMGFLSLFGENGFLGSQFLSIVLAHSFFNIPLVVLYFSSYYRTFDQNLIGAAKTLGSKGLHRFFRVFLPVFLPPILSASMLTFIYCFMSYGIVTILSSSFRTLEIQIYADYFEREESLGSALALIQLLFILAIIIAYLIIMRIQTRRQTIGKTEVFPLEKLNLKRLMRSPKFVALFLVFIFGFIFELAPIISIIVRSFWDPKTNQFLNNYALLFDSSLEPTTHIAMGKAITNTLLFAIGSSLIAGALAIITVSIIGIKKRRKSTISFEILSYLPIIVSSVTLSIGIREIFYRFSLFNNFPWIFILISQALLGYPFIIRALLNGINNLDQDLLDSAQTLGAKWWFKFRKIYFPLLFRSFIAGFIFALGLSLSEFTVVNFFSYDNLNLATLTVVLSRLRARSEYIGAANAVGVMLLFISYLTFIILELLNAREKTISKI
ncbi:MAG: iron ABC transporter permease [Asgard group archaeon]|nr:iron ABC transporter permease [Asgard group archaeon]